MTEYDDDGKLFKFHTRIAVVLYGVSEKNINMGVVVKFRDS